MSNYSRSATEKLILKDLPEVFEGSSTARWSAISRLRARAESLAAREGIDEELIREVAAYNAGRLGLDFFAADKVFNTVKKPGGGSLAAMHAPSYPMWDGTGSSMAATRDGKIVHYINNPGEAEEKYGPALPYVLDKLGWLAAARDIKDHPQIHHGEGYRYVANRLNRIGRKGTRPHLGSIAVYREGVFEARGNNDLPEELLVSVSGTLASTYQDQMYERLMPELIARADQDRANGLFDGWEPNKRAGIYDIAFGEMVGELLYGANIDHRMLSAFDIPGYFADVDIN